VPQPKGNFLMELTDLPFHGSDFTGESLVKIINLLKHLMKQSLDGVD
jgi:hypothetical protein